MVIALWIVGILAIVCLALAIYETQQEKGQAMPIGGLIAFGLPAVAFAALWLILAGLHWL